MIPPLDLHEAVAVIPPRRTGSTFSPRPMRAISLLLALASLLTACSEPAAQDPDAPLAPDPAAEAVQAAVELTYEVTSFTDAATADPERFREAFTPTARLAFVRDGRAVERTVDDYVEIRRSMLAGGEVRSLVERELWGHTEHFGTLAHRWSAYEVHINGAEEPAERGIMSFQLVRTDAGWKVHSLAWQAERDTLRLPPPPWAP